MTDGSELTSGDEDIDPRTFAAEEKDPKEPRLGSWPDPAGLGVTLLLTWLIFAFTE